MNLNSPQSDQEILDVACIAYEDAVERGETPVLSQLLPPGREDLLDKLRDNIRMLEAFRTPTNIDKSALRIPKEAFDQLRYKPYDYVTSGGLGDLFRASDIEVDRPVALKRLREDRAQEPTARRWFLHEARLTARLKHPGIVPVFGVGEDATGIPWYAMPFIEGHTLRDAINLYHDAAKPQADPQQRRFRKLLLNDPESDSPLTTDERAEAQRGLLRRFITVCNAVAYAHQRGVMHRDLKPINIMLGNFGETLVIDWGMAKPYTANDTTAPLEPETADTALSPDRELSRSIAHGTIGYMPPEQARRQQTRLGPHTDIFALGATLHHLLTGEPPLKSMDHAFDAKFKPPREINEDTPRALEAICLKAMQKEPEDRYPTAQAIAEDVEQWLADEAVSAWREPWSYRVRRWMRKHRTLVMSTVVGLLFALVAMSVIIFERTEAEERERLLRIDAEAKERKATESEKREKKLAALNVQQIKRNALQQIELDKRMRAELSTYVSKIRLAHEFWQKGEIANARQMLASVSTNDAKKDDLRSFEWYYLDRLSRLSEEKAYRDQLRTIESLAFSPDGEYMASGSRDGTVLVRDAKTGKILHSLIPNAKVEDGVVGIQPTTFKATGEYAVSATIPRSAAELSGQLKRGDAIVAVSDDNDQMIPTNGLNPKALIKLISGRVGTKVRLKIRKLQTQEVKTVTLIRRRIQQELPALIAPILTLFHPHGDWLLTATQESIKIWDYKTGKEIRGWPIKGCLIRDVAVSPDGKFLAIVNGNAVGKGPVVQIWNADTQKKIHEIPVIFADSVAFSPDSKFLATGTVRRIYLWDVKKGTLSKTAQTVDSQFNFSSIAFSPDGNQMVGQTSERIVYWNLQTPPDPKTQEIPVRTVIRQGADVYQSIAISKNGRLLATTAGKVIQLWDAKTGSLKNTLRGHFNLASRVAFAPNSTALVSGDTSGQIIFWDRHQKQDKRTLIGTSQRSPVNSLAFAPNGKKIFVGAGYFETDKPLSEILEYKPDKSIFPTRYQRQTSGLIDASFSYDERLVATLEGVGSYSVDVWDIVTGIKRLTLYDPQKRFWAVRLARNADTIITAGIPLANVVRPNLLEFSNYPGKIWFWDAKNGKLLRTLPGPRGPSHLYLTSDGKTLISAGRKDSEINFWDIGTGRHLKLLKQPGFVHSLAVSPNQRYMAVVIGDVTDLLAKNCKVVLQDFSNDKTLELDNFHKGLVTVRISHNGKLLATGGVDGQIGIWDLPSGKLLRKLRGHKSWVETMDFLPDNQTLVSLGHSPGVSRKKELKYWNVTTGENLKESSKHRCSAVVVSPSGKMMLLGSLNESNHVIQNVKTEDVIQELQPWNPNRHKAAISAVAVSPDGKTLATASWDKTVKLWDIDTGTFRATLVGHNSSVLDLAFSQDGSILASGSGKITRQQKFEPEPGEVILWNMKTRTMLKKFPTQERGVTCLAFAPDGKTLYTGTRALLTNDRRTTKFGEIAVYTVPSGKVQKRWNYETTKNFMWTNIDVAVSPNGRWVATAGLDRTYIVRIWDKNNKVVHEIPLADPPHAVVFSPDNKTLVTGDHHGNVRLWQVATGEELLSFDVGNENVIALAFSPDGLTLAVGTHRGEVYLWRASSRK